MPVNAIVGLPGAGKTYWAARAMYRLRRQQPERMIVSNTPLYLPGKPVPVVERIEQVWGLQNCTLLLDELHLWGDSADWKKGRAEMAEWISQLRKRDVDLYYTTHDPSGVNKLVRDRCYLTFQVESFKGLGFFYWKGYYGQKVDKNRKYLSGWYLFNPKVAAVYDTEFIVKV